MRVNASSFLNLNYLKHSSYKWSFWSVLVWPRASLNCFFDQTRNLRDPSLGFSSSQRLNTKVVWTTIYLKKYYFEDLTGFLRNFRVSSFLFSNSIWWNQRFPKNAKVEIPLWYLVAKLFKKSCIRLMLHSPNQTRPILIDRTVFKARTYLSGIPRAIIGCFKTDV